LSTKTQAQTPILEKEVESLTRDLLLLQDEVKGLHAELSQIRAVFDNLDRNGLLYGKESGSQ
jgi:hypothetical protein